MLCIARGHIEDLLTRILGIYFLIASLDLHFSSCIHLNFLKYVRVSVRK